MRFLALILLFMVGCAADFGELTPEPIRFLEPNTSIGDLDEGTVRGDWVVRGVVTTSDSCGNFYRSMVIEDGTGALEVRVSFYDLWSLYRRGELVSVQLFERTITRNEGLLGVDMGSFALATTTILRQGWSSEPEPRVVTISQIDSTMVGTLVRIEGGHFESDDAWSGEHYFRTGNDRIAVYTSPGASYANEPLPPSTLDISAIVTLYRGKFQLKMSSNHDAVPSKN